MSKLIGKYVTKIIYNQAFKVGLVGNKILNKYGAGHAKKISLFKKVYLVNHLHDILEYSCKWLLFKYSFRCKGLKNAFAWFHFYEIVWLTVLKALRDREIY